MKSAERDGAPFVVRTRGPRGEEDHLARAVIDASGTLGRPRPLGASGLPAIGEEEAAERVRYGVPDVLGRDRERYAGRRVAVVGGGASAFNALTDLARLAAEAPGTTVEWVLRGGEPHYGGGASDQLPARGALGERVRELVEAGRGAGA